MMMKYNYNNNWYGFFSLHYFSKEVLCIDLFYLLFSGLQIVQWTESNQSQESGGQETHVRETTGWETIYKFILKGILLLSVV